MPIYIEENTIVKFQLNSSLELKTQQQSRERKMYRLRFKFDYWNASPESIQAIRETYEHLCWETSPIKVQADKLGWVDDPKKLPIFDNSQLFLSHHLYYSLNSRFLKQHCPHITAMAPEGHDYTGGTVKKVGGRYAA